MIGKGLYGKKYLQVETRERSIQLTSDKHVIVRIEACGVCGTDLNFLRDWEGDPLPLGHEIAGEVVEIGKLVTTVKPGDKVVVEDCSMCGVCRHCKDGRPEHCSNMVILEDQPGMGEYLSVPDISLVKYDGLDCVAASLTEPLAVSLTAVLNARVPLGGSVVVFGAGPLGLMAAALARLQGASFVGITSLPGENAREKARLNLAKQLDCDMVIEVGKQSIQDLVLKRFTGGIDRVIVSAPPTSLYDAFDIIRFGGIICYFGLDLGGHNIINLDVNDMIYRKISLIPTFAAPAMHFAQALTLLRDGLVDADMFITHKFLLKEAEGYLRGILEGNLPVIKGVMLPGP
ncbi:MAG: alcohol dehydrogenase catalytic domain-containing protein [Anaerolineales bacterium]|nr:alcohol dehydrogenase catalytic domain-containing protein [Anaerolineales bacterium]